MGDLEVVSGRMAIGTAWTCPKCGLANLSPAAESEVERASRCDRCGVSVRVEIRPDILSIGGR